MFVLNLSISTSNDVFDGQDIDNDYNPLDDVGKQVPFAHIKTPTKQRGKQISHNCYYNNK